MLKKSLPHSSILYFQLDTLFPHYTSESTKIKQLEVVAEKEDIRTTPSRPAHQVAGQADRSASPPGGTVQAPALPDRKAATAWTEIPATAGYTALCLPLLPPVTKLVSHVAPIILPANAGRNIVTGDAPTASLAVAAHRLLNA